MSRLEISVLGTPYITLDGTAVSIKRQKAIALLAYLAVTGRRHARDTLAALFWPESDKTQAKNVLRQTLHTLKKALGEKWLKIERESLALRRTDDVWLDVDKFDHHLAMCETHGHPLTQVCVSCLTTLAEAADLYRDEFLAGFTLPDSPEFDDWVRLQGDQLRNKFSDVLERLVRGYAAREEPEQALPYALRWLELDPYNEEAHRRLMYLYALSGQRASARRQYDSCVHILKHELGVAPQAETTQLSRDIEAGKVPLPAFVASALASVCPHNLLLQATPCIGREKDMAAISQSLLAPEHRMLTLTGAGGIGKTRLAIEMATHMTSPHSKSATTDAPGYPFEHGVYFVPLAPLTSVDLLVPTLASAIGFSFYGNTDLKEQLLNYLREKHMLLVLDNFEHLLDGAELAVEILSTAPGVKLIITSRERLNLEWEWPFEIRGLNYPYDDDLPTPEDYSAVQLFLQSARRAYPQFSLTREAKPFVARICRALEGVPLAIKLAAAWVEILSCEEIAQAIERNLDLLATSAPDVTERHRSVKATFDHSWQLLSEEEQRVLRQLSVFPGEFQRTDANDIAGASLSHLSALMHKSLLQRSATGRHTMVEVLRQCAAEKLREVPEEYDEAHDRLCAHYAEFMHQREPALDGAEREKILEEIGAEIENVETGWKWAVAQGQRREMALYLQGLCEYYEVRGYYNLGQKTLEQAVIGLNKILTEDTSRTENPELLGLLLMRQGRFYINLAYYEKGQKQLQTALRILRQFNPGLELALTFASLGLAKRLIEEHKEAKLFLKEAANIYRACDSQRGIGDCLNQLGMIASRQSKYQQAENLHEKSLTAYKKAGYRPGIGANLNNMGLIAMNKGEFAKAQKLFQDSLTVMQVTKNRRLIATTLSNLAIVTNNIGDTLKAKRLHTESLTIHRELNDRRGIAINLVNLGAIALEQAKYDEAQPLFEQSLAIYREIGAQKFSATVMICLGLTAEGVKAYAKAKTYHQESIAIYREAEDKRDLANGLVSLAFTLCALKEYEEAWKGLDEALGLSIEIKANTVMLEALTGIARLLAGEGKREIAAEMVACILDHPAADTYTKGRATALLTELQTQLPAQVIETAQKKGRTKGIEYYTQKGLKLAGAATSHEVKETPEAMGRTHFTKIAENAE